MSCLLSIEQLTFSYPNKAPILSDVTLQIKQGEFWGIIGPNGVGKSTLLKLITGYLAPQNGQVRLLDKPVRTLKPLELAQRVAVVRQDIPGELDMTVEELVMLGRFPHLPSWGRESAKDYEIVHDKMHSTAVDHLAQHHLRAISGGERQRAFLAQALAQEPILLLLDEPTSHLDIKHQVSTMELLRSQNRQTNLTVIAILHDLNLAALFCDKLALLSQGQLMVSGSVKEVMTQQWLGRAYDSKVVIVPHPLNAVPQVHLLPTFPQVVKQHQEA